jgi:hypothetical protein
MEERLFHWGASIIVISTFLHTFLPPWDFLNDFPTLQKYYKLLIYIVGYTAGNARSTVWQKISVNNPAGPNANIPTLVTEVKEAKEEGRPPVPIAPVVLPEDTK